MLYMKKYFTEGLIQVAILLSLCGLRLDGGLEPYLPQSWHNMILGSTSALTQNQFRNRLEDGHSLHPKSVDLDQFFTVRRLLGWGCSQDRLQVPPVELETWVVQQEIDPPAGGLPHWPSWQESEGTEEDRNQAGLGDPERAENEELSDIDGRIGALVCQTSDTEALQAPMVVPEDPCPDLELQWQDLLDILQPENTNAEMMTSFNPTMDLGTSGTFQDVESDALPQLLKSLDCVVPQSHQLDPQLQHGLVDTLNPSELQPGLLPLAPSSELDDHSPTPNSRAILGNSGPYSLNTPTNYTELLADDSDFASEVNNLTFFNMNLLTQEDKLESTNLSGFGVNFPSRELPAPCICQRNNLTQDLMVSPSNAFLLPEEDEEDLPSPLTDLLEDPNILEGIRLLDIALEEGLSPEVEEEEYSDGETFRQESGRDQRPPSQKEDAGDEMDSDSGLSVNFSHSPASSYVSDGSTHYSSTSTPTTPSPSWVSAEAGDDVIGSDIEFEVTVKQEKLEEEEMGAVGGDVKQLFPASYVDHKRFHSFKWREHIGHDHTYNQPSSSTHRCKTAPKSIKSAFRHHKAKPYHDISETRNWNRDERQARTLRIPFTNELIVHLPVEDFNDLLSSSQLTDEQLALVKDIRRRGKNKIAAQNCRKRKLDVLLGLEREVSDLRHHFSQLLREKREALRHMQEMKHRLRALHEEVFSQLRDEEGRPLNATEHVLHFGPNGSVTVASDKNSRKQRRNEVKKKTITSEGQML